MIPGYCEKEKRLVVGLMSGTSVDGIDAALVEIGGTPQNPRPRLVAFCDTPFPQEVRREIFKLFNPEYATVKRLGRMNFLLGQLYAQAVLDVAEKAGIAAGDIDCIGSHGQTIYHQPQEEDTFGFSVKYTVQIGEGAVIAEKTGVPCFSDFRVADMAAGGHGAPLVPFTEYLLYTRADETILLQNIGGIGNITVLPAGAQPQDVLAFDTGPGNMLIDGLIAHYTNGAEEMDKGGALAGKGTPNEKLLDILKNDAYYSLPLPKTTGREYFGSEYVDKIIALQKDSRLTNEDTAATVTMLTAWSIADAYRRYIKPKTPAARLIVGGGGSYNPVLLGYLAEQFKADGVAVETQEDAGQSSDAKEAVAFAILADRAAAGLYNALPNVTGAQGAAVMGKLSLPAKKGMGLA